MPRQAMIVHQVHGSNANLLTRPAVYGLAFSGVTGGFLTATFNGVTSAQITASASLPTLAAFQAALEAVSSIGVGNVLVTGTPGGPYVITFRAALLDTSLTFTVDGSGLTGTTPTATLTYAGADFDAIQSSGSGGESLVVTGRETILLHNPTGGSPINVTVPSSLDAQNRLNDSLISTVTIPSPGWLLLPKFAAKGWSQGADGIHLNPSASGLLALVMRDPED